MGELVQFKTKKNTSKKLPDTETFQEPLAELLLELSSAGVGADALLDEIKSRSS